MTRLPDLVLARYFDGADGRSERVGADAGRVSVGAGLGRAERRIAAALVQEVASRPTVALAGLAPLVMQAYDSGDPAAEHIVCRAAGMLVSTLSQARPAESDAPIVLAGAILTAHTPVRDLVLADVARRWPTAEVTVADDGAAGAAWLAALGLGVEDAETLHVRLLDQCR